jgi:hypothetical protein
VSFVDSLIRSRDSNVTRLRERVPRIGVRGNGRAQQPEVSMSMTTDSSQQAYEASLAERDADELTDGELECVSGGDSWSPRKPL